MPRFQIDFRFVEIEAELWALRQFLSVVEDQITSLIDEDARRLHAANADLEWEDPSFGAERQEHDIRSTRVFPRFMRNPFLVALWACYESGVEEVAAELLRKKGKGLRLRDIRGENWLECAVTYFAEVHGWQLESDPGLLEAIRDLLVVRNCVAHANGQVRSIPENKLKKLRAVAARQRGVAIDDGLIVTTPEYLAGAFAAVDSSLSSLVTAVRGDPSVRKIPPEQGA